MAVSKDNSITITLTMEETRSLIRDLEGTVYIAGECALGDNHGVNEYEIIGRVDSFVGRLSQEVSTDEETK